MTALQQVRDIPYKNLTEWTKIGNGSFGTVYKAKLDGSYVAVKELNSPATKYRKSLENEIKQLFKVQPHENIIEFLGTSTETVYGMEETYLVLEYADCGSFYDFLHGSQKRLYSAVHVLNWLYQCAAGLNHLHTAHEQVIVHRDLKTLNLLLLNNYTTLKISDFGTVAELKSSMTNGVGTPLWMAPEVFTGSGERAAYTEKCDIYSFGMIMWEVISRRLPFEDILPIGELLRAVIAGRRPPRIDGCPAVLTNLMERCWDPNPCKRPSITEILGVMGNLRNRFDAIIPTIGNQTAPPNQIQAVIQELYDTLTSQ